MVIKIIYIILIVIAGWLFLSFFVARLFIPHLGFWKSKLPDKIPQSMSDKINELKRKSKSSSGFLRLAHEFLGNKYHTERLNTIFKFYYVFLDIDKVWEKSGFIHCTQSANMMRVFLVKSGLFRDKDIKIKHTFASFTIHQYLQVKIDDKWIDVDVGEKNAEIPLGKHCRFWNLF